VAPLGWMLCRTENRVGQLAQAEPGKQTTEARALDAKLGGRPSDGLVAGSVVLRLGDRWDMRAWSLSHANRSAKFGTIRRRYPIVIQ